MNQSDRQTNLRLKREVLRLATRVSTAFPGTAVAEIALMRRELGGLEDCEQNQSLNDHLLFLQETLQEMLQVPHRDSTAMRPPPSTLRAPASTSPAASAAGVHAGLKRGREDDPSSSEQGAPPSAQRTAAWSWMQPDDSGGLPACGGMPPACGGPLPKQDGQTKT